MRIQIYIFIFIYLLIYKYIDMDRYIQEYTRLCVYLPINQLYISIYI